MFLLKSDKNGYFAHLWSDLQVADNVFNRAKILQAKIEQKNHSRMLSAIYFPHNSYGFRDIKERQISCPIIP
jgi:hypothetical protein